MAYKSHLSCPKTLSCSACHTPATSLEHVTVVYELFGDQLAHRAIRRPLELLLHGKIIDFVMSSGIQVMERRGGLCIPLCPAVHKKMPTGIAHTHAATAI